jgi:hypothetical protein
MLQATIKTTYVFTSISRYFCPTLIKFGVFRQIFFFIKVFNVKFYGNPCNGSCYGTFVQMD